MFVEQMEQVSRWITSTAPSRAVQGLDGYVPTLQSIHILAIAAVIACTTLLNLRLLGVMYRSAPVTRVGQRLSRPVWLALLVLVLTGSGLLLAEPERSLTSQVFQLKMLLLVVGGLLSWRLLRQVHAGATEWDRNGGVPLSAKLAAVLLLLVWPLIIFAGRWIAYAQY